MARLFAMFVLSFALWAAPILAAPATTSASAAASAATTPPPPSKDPWYRAPPGFEIAPPGAVLKVRDAPGLVPKVANSSAAYNVLYRTTDSNYKPSWAVTTLFVPKAAAGSGPGKPSPAPLLSYQFYYDSANVDQSPSYTLYTSDQDPSVPLALGLGAFVNVPDFEGPRASFTAGVQSGHATIDSVRAVRRARFGLSAATTPVALWGYSGGALASEWAAELQVQYAPELKFAGVALGGLTPNVSSVALATNKAPAAELIPNGILGLASQDPAALKVVLADLKPEDAAKFLAARNQTDDMDTLAYADQDVFGYFKDGTALLSNPVIQALVDRDAVMGYHGVPASPVFAYKAIHDEVSPIADTDALIARYCAVGANILYQRNSVGGHTAEALNGGLAAFEFLEAVLTGTYAAKYKTTGCTVQNVTVALDSSPLRRMKFKF